MTVFSFYLEKDFDSINQKKYNDNKKKNSIAPIKNMCVEALQKKRGEKIIFFLSKKIFFLYIFNYFDTYFINIRVHLNNDKFRNQ